MGWQEEVKIDPMNLSACLAEQPGKYAYYASVAAQASHTYQEAKAEGQALEAQVDHEIRTRYKALGDRITVKEVEAEIALDSRVQSGRKGIRDLKLQKDLTKVAADAFEQRLQAMISMGALVRAEMRSIEPFIGSGSGHTTTTLSEQEKEDRIREMAKKSGAANSPS